MARQVQLRRGSTADHATFVGVEGETTVDTDEWSIRVHDGVTEGGHLLAKQGDSPAVSSSDIDSIITLTQNQYNLIAIPDPRVLYIIRPNFIQLSPALFGVTMNYFEIY